MSETGDSRATRKRKAFIRKRWSAGLTGSLIGPDALAAARFALKISENHLRDLMDWLEEIALARWAEYSTRS